MRRGVGGDAGEEEPADDVVDRGRRDGDDADRGAGQAELAEDAAEDGNGGDGDRDAAKQAVGEPVYIGREGCGGQQAEGEAAGERAQDGNGGNPRGGRAMAFVREVAEFEIGADLEHQQEQADLAEDGDCVPGEAGEQRLECLWKQVAEEGRAEGKSADDFSDHARLSERACERIEGACDGDHDGNFEQECREQVLGRRHGWSCPVGPVVDTASGEDVFRLFCKKAGLSFPIGCSSMSDLTGLEMRTTVAADGLLTLDLVDVTVAAPGPDEVVVAMGGRADQSVRPGALAGASRSGDVVPGGTSERPEITERSRRPAARHGWPDRPVHADWQRGRRHGRAAGVGRGAGAVGQDHRGTGGAMYAQFRTLRAATLLLPDGATAADGASCSSIR